MFFPFKELLISIPDIHFTLNSFSPFLFSNFFQWPHSHREIIYHTEETKLLTIGNGKSVTKRDANRCSYELKIDGERRKRVVRGSNGFKVYSKGR